MSTKYSNPWPSYRPPTLSAILSSLQLPTSTLPESVRPNVVCPDFDFPCHNPRPMWLGHASVYLQLPRAHDPPLGILFDPVFSKRCSPIACIGPKRRVAPPCRVQDLPCVHLVILSHDHYDHLDEKTIRNIERYFEDVQYIVPNGLLQWFVKRRVTQTRVREMGWWDETTLYERVFKIDSNDADIVTKTSASDEKAGIVNSTTTLVDGGKRAEESLRIICTPAQHNSGRSVFHHNETLWASWVLEWNGILLPPFRVFFGGDTGYRSDRKGPTCPIFNEITKRFGSPDLAFLPMAAGSVLPFLEKFLPFRLDHTALTSSLHCSARDAVQVHQQMKCRKSVGIHWGTFTTGQHASETLAEYDEACRVDGVSKDWNEDESFSIQDVGTWFEAC